MNDNGSLIGGTFVMVLMLQIGKVMRIRKASRSGANAMTMRSPSALTAHECLLWKDVHEFISSPDSEIASQIFVQHVMKPLLGSKYVDAGVCVVLHQIRVHNILLCLILLLINVLYSAVFDTLINRSSMPPLCIAWKSFCEIDGSDYDL